MKAILSTGVLWIEEYDYPSFLKVLQSSINEGYEIDFEDNKNYPTAYVGFYSCGLVKKESKNEAPSVEQIEVEQKTIKPVEQPATRGRKTK